MYIRFLILLISSIIYGQGFFDRTLGREISPISVRAAGMGNTAVSSSSGVSAILSNPSLIGKPDTKIEVIFNFDSYSIYERRSIILKDFFGDFLAEGDYVNNAYSVYNFSGGLSYNLFSSNYDFDLGLYYGSLLSFNTEYQEEVRGDIDCENGIPCTRDILVGYHNFQTRGNLDVLSMAASIGSKFNFGELYFGLTKHHTFNSEINSSSSTDSLNFMVDNLSKLPNSSSKYTLPSNGFYSASVSANLINQFLLTAAIETELNLTPNEQSHFGIYNQTNGLIEYFIDCNDFQCTDSLNNQESIMLNQPVVRPAKKTIGFAYQPINIIPMTFAVEYDIRDYSKPSLISKNNFEAYQLSDSLSLMYLEPDVKLKSHKSVKVGIEYTTITKTTLRTGLQYSESPLPGFSPESTLTFGFGKAYDFFQLDISGYYKMIKYSYPDVFKVDGEFRQDYDTVRESDKGFSIGIKYFL